MAIFASKFGMGFFERLLKRQPAGKIVVDLRKEFLNAHNNLLGLYYVGYFSSNLRLNSPLL
jgi:hypothetical protein